MIPIVKNPEAHIHSSVLFDGEAEVGFCSYVGFGDESEPPTRIGAGVRIGAFCIIEKGVHIEENVEIDHYCRISSGTRIGSNTRVLYRASIFNNVTIGQNCIIAGELVDRTVVGNEVTFQGDTAHRHNDPTLDWDETEEPSPAIQYGSVVGVGAVLIGDIRIGPRSWVAAGEIVTCDVPEETVLKDGELHPLAYFRGSIKVRGK
jgi:UDP-3-O-[3-hydroxymyristoyl] glucosamine N-acyltransferase